MARTVIELDADLKLRFEKALAGDGRMSKHLWFITRVREYCAERETPGLPLFVPGDRIALCRHLEEALAREGRSLAEWFTSEAGTYLATHKPVELQSATASRRHAVSDAAAAPPQEAAPSKREKQRKGAKKVKPTAGTEAVAKRKF